MEALSFLAIGLAVVLFWAALVAAICALAGANSRSRDMVRRDVDTIREASRPAPLNAITLEHAHKHVRGISS